MSFEHVEIDIERSLEQPAESADFEDASRERRYAAQDKRARLQLQEPLGMDEDLDNRGIEEIQSGQVNDEI